MSKPKELTESERRALIEYRYQRAYMSDKELRTDRTDALNAYYGKPMGNEQEGRSNVVSKDMMDTIEWIMPSLLRVFMRDAVQFDPVGPEDEALAKQETDYVRHVIWKKNDGFVLIHNWLKDALMQKVGYVLYNWEDEDKVEFDQYDGLNDEQLTMVMQELEQEGEVEVRKYRQDPKTGYHAIEVRVKRTYGCVKIENVQPDEVIVSNDCRGSIKKSNFAGRIRKISRSDLMQLGFKREELENLTDFVWDNHSGEQLARDSVGENATTRDDENSSEWASQEMTLLECYTNMDADQDGIAEMRHFLMGGEGFLIDEEFPEIPMESWTPVIIPHRHIGLSIYDLIEDLQRIKTALQRGLLDNVYFTNNPRTVYNQNVDVKSLQVNKPGGHVLVMTESPVQGDVMPMPVSPQMGNILPVITYFDEVKENRSGVGRMTSGVDANVLAQSTKGAYSNAQTAANQRIEAIARIFAETALGPLYLSVHRLLLRHQNWAVQEKLRGNWITVDPTMWKERTHLTVSVGLGNANQEEIRQNLMMMGQVQQQAAQMPGIVQPQNVYNLCQKMQTELGFEAQAFFTDPKSDEYKQFMQSQGQQKDPYVQGKEIDAQAKMAGAQLDRKTKLEINQSDREVAITELELDSGVDLAKAGIGADVAVDNARESNASRERTAAAGESAAAGSVPPDGGGPVQPAQESQGGQP